MARENMILNQIRSWGVLDERIIELLNQYPREHFVDAGHKGIAYADIILPLTTSRYMLPPSLEARLLQAMNPGANDHLLVVGTGSGYLTALLAVSSAFVTSVETDESLVVAAREKMKRANISNVRLEVGDATGGWPNHAPYDGILLAGGVSKVAPELLEQLSTGGQLVALEGATSPLTCVKLLKESQGISRENLFETEVPYFDTALPETEFEF
ncbi:MAG: protein-L-isoaspartate O-methyltransferase [Gammaproteobacteria bacterium]